MDFRIDREREMTELSDVLEFRVELLRKQTLEQWQHDLYESRSAFATQTIDYAHPWNDPREMVQNAVWSVSGLIDPGDELDNRSDDAPHPIQLRRQDFSGDHLQVACLLFLDDIRLVRLGEAQGFYPQDCVEDLLTFLDKAEPALTPLTDLALSASRYWTRQLPASHQQVTLVLGRSDYLTHIAEWNDLVCDEFNEGVDLLLFASDELWQQRLGDVITFATALAENPSLSLAPDQADRISWALSGLDRLLEFDRDQELPAVWSTTVGAILTGEADDRLERLRQARRAVAVAAGLMTTNETVAAMRRLTRALDQ